MGLEISHDFWFKAQLLVFKQDVLRTMASIILDLEEAVSDLILSVFVFLGSALGILFAKSLVLTSFLQSALGWKLKPREPSTIVITGASSGIGAALAVQYSKPGRRLFLIARNKERLEEVRQRCLARGATAVEIESIDLAIRGALDDYLDKLYERQFIDLFIANAGTTFYEPGANTVTQSDVFKKQIVNLLDVNLTNTVTAVWTVYERMKARGGQIAVISSITGFVGPPNTLFYNTSKAALNSFTQNLRLIAAKDNIHVNLITPGYIDTPMLAAAKSTIAQTLWESPESLARAVERQLANDVNVIAYPKWEMWLSYPSVSFAPNVKEWVGWVAAKGKFLGDQIS